MGLASTNWIPAVVFALGCAGSVSAAPKLRLTNAAIGPVSIATGANGPQQVLDAYNAGDGDLSLTATSSVPWISASAGEPGNCSLRAGLCTPIRFGLETASLARGTYTGLVTVSDPNALDAPQTVTVTVQIGGAVPDKLRFQVTAGGSHEQVIRASNLLGIVASTDSGVKWLSLPAEGGGSFRFNFNYKVVASHLPGMSEGEHTGKLTVFNSRIQEENKQVSVALSVTSGPILQAPERLILRLAEGAAPYSAGIPLSNRGGGTLTLSGVKSSMDPAGAWLAGEVIDDGRGVQLRVDPTGLSQGTYSGLLELASNSANPSVSIPVLLEIMPVAAPAGDYATLANIATLESEAPLAPGMLVRLQGTQFTSQLAATAEAPFPDNLAGCKVYVNGAAAAMLTATPNEIVFQLPYGVEPGDAVLQVERDGQVGNMIGAVIAARVPRVELAAGAYARATLPDGVLALPESLAGRPAQPGETVTLAMIGLGQTDPAVEAGALPPVEPPAIITEPVRVSFGASLFYEGIVVDATSAALVAGSPGRYAVKVVVPEDAPRGDKIDVVVTAGGVPSNKVQIAIR
ncbi:MAG: hypothetical protein HZB13_15200 [Acidobacteria bacterium]|nr:hypothetical protein [Acidobacteriota bacterium]